MSEILKITCLVDVYLVSAFLFQSTSDWAHSRYSRVGRLVFDFRMETLAFSQKLLILSKTSLARCRRFSVFVDLVTRLIIRGSMEAVTALGVSVEVLISFLEGLYSIPIILTAYLFWKQKLENLLS